MCSRRALHFVFKVGDRPKTIKFFKDVLGMKVLRHEEFEEGCKATCNGPYDGKWSKTMVGYGEEDNNFVIELTYNYGVSNYTLGNDFLGIVIASQDVLNKAREQKWPMTPHGKQFIVEAPGGYKFYLESNRNSKGERVVEVILGSSDLEKSLNYWHNQLGLKIFSKEESEAVLGFVQHEQCHLRLKYLGQKINHASAFGRVAFSCPAVELPELEKRGKEAGGKVITPFVSLDTPGKATVQVVILGDPDGHEICFVNDEGFRQLSQFDKDSDGLLLKAMSADKSDEWFQKKGKSKASA